MDSGHNRVRGMSDRDDLPLQSLLYDVLHTLPDHAVRLQCDDAFVDLLWDLGGFLYPLRCVVRCFPY